MAEKKKLTKAEKKELIKKQRGSLWKDFKAFINRGNVVDMAVGVIMGSAFGRRSPNVNTRRLSFHCNSMVEKQPCS